MDGGVGDKYLQFLFCIQFNHHLIQGIILLYWSLFNNLISNTWLKSNTLLKGFISFRNILHENLDEDFNVKDINYRLEREGGTPTLFAAGIDNPDHTILPAVNKIPEYVGDSFKNLYCPTF